MALRINVKHGFKFDTENYVHALLTVSESVQRIPSKPGKTKNSIVTDDKERFEDVILYTFQCETMGKEAKELNSLVFNTTFNAEIMGTYRDKTKNVNSYNKFTQTLLKLNIVTEKNLSNFRNGIDEIDVEIISEKLLAIENLPVRFKIQKLKDKNYDEVDWRFFEVLPIGETE